MKISMEIKPGDEFVQKSFPKLHLIVTRIDENFSGIKGKGAIMAVNNQDGKEIAYSPETFLDYYQPASYAAHINGGNS